jgi:carotenoid cleavage dioxygenase
MSRTPWRSSTPPFLPERIHKAPVNPTTQTNPYFFTGNYAPLGEERDIAALDIEGTLPPGLSGSLYRVGPSPQYAPRDNDYHWFSGDGMVHAFHIDAGVVSYRNRWARTPKWQLEHEAGHALFGTFGNPATSDPLVQGLNGGTANTSMLWHGDRLFALEESHQPFELDAHTLASKGHQSFSGRVDSRCTAHPKADPETGELHFFAYSPDGPCSPTMRYGVMDRHCEVTQLQSFTAPHASMAHDFMVTRGHVLFPVTPLTLSMERAMRGKPLLAWDASLRTHVGVMRRGSDSGGGGTGTLRWFDTDACHVFHVMNAWDDGDTIVAYVMQSETAPGLPDAEGRPGDPAAMAARLCRWTFDLRGDGTAFQREYLDDLVAEFPRIDERYTGRRNRYGFYTCHATPRARGDAESVLYDSLARFDFDTGKREMHTLPPGDVVSEPVFVPRAADAPEGDGWLLAVAWRAQEERSDLLVFDARDLEAGAVAVARLPHRVPFGFHGSWRSNA